MAQQIRAFADPGEDMGSVVGANDIWSDQPMGVVSPDTCLNKTKEGALYPLSW